MNLFESASQYVRMNAYTSDGWLAHVLLFFFLVGLSSAYNVILVCKFASNTHTNGNLARSLHCCECSMETVYSLRIVYETKTNSPELKVQRYLNISVIGFTSVWLTVCVIFNSSG